MNRILVAVHGYEPRGWVDQVVRALPPAGASAVRILVVLDAPSPPFTSLLPAARGRYLAAQTHWRRLAETQTQPCIATLAATLQPPPEVERVAAGNKDTGRVIVEHARAWAADLVVVGRDTRGWLERALSRPAHERVVDDAPCPVFVTSAEAPLPPDPVQVSGGQRLARQFPAATGGA
ncbi:MAG TPA: universal stress protein [Methylomirabilota bacterium]|jgi:nucleotide-binding universal stress UspA family protein